MLDHAVMDGIRFNLALVKEVVVALLGLNLGLWPFV